MPTFRKLSKDEVNVKEQPIIKRKKGRPKKDSMLAQYTYKCVLGCILDTMTYNPDMMNITCGKHKLSMYDIKE